MHSKVGQLVDAFRMYSAMDLLAHICQRGSIRLQNLSLNRFKYAMCYDPQKLESINKTKRT